MIVCLFFHSIRSPDPNLNDPGRLTPHTPCLNGQKQQQNQVFLCILSTKEKLTNKTTTTTKKKSTKKSIVLNIDDSDCVVRLALYFPL